MLRSYPIAAAALAGFAAASLGAPRAAEAATTTISGSATLGGTQPFDELVIDNGMLSVQHYVAGMPDSGKLVIKANRITVNANATISATGAGYPGVELTNPDGNGQAEMGSNGGGKAGSKLGFPGGGGGYFGAGAPGLDAACMAFGAPDNATGGAAFFPMSNVLTLGSAGGAANVMSMVTRGGAGGGMIVLEAAEIVIEGRVEANGESPNAQSGVAPGGGSGGTIQIITAKLTGSGVLSVIGGSGATAAGDMGKMIPANNGGGGSGGIIQITAPAIPMTLTANFQGGATGSCMAPGGVGALLTPAPSGPCIDVDGDMHDSALCGGDDCDDSDKDSFPGGTEKCDGHDNDCNMQVDDGDLCQAGETCAPTPGGAKCAVITDGGTDGGTGSSARPDHVEFHGGCGVSPAAAEVPLWLGCAVPSLGAVGLVLRGLSSRRKRRRGRSAR